MTYIKINNKNKGKSTQCIGSFMAVGKQSQIIVISGKTKNGCHSFDIYSYKGIYVRSISIFATADKCK